MRSACVSPHALVYNVAGALQELLETTSRLSMRMGGLSRPPSRSGRPQRQSSVPLDSGHISNDFFQLHQLQPDFMYQPEGLSPFGIPPDGNFQPTDGDTFTAYDLFDGLLPM